MKSPEIIQISMDTNFSKIKEKAPFYVPEWNTENENDSGYTLSRIFSVMSETIASRLNEAPQKHFLSFLEMINSSLIPVSPARVPLTFALSEGASENVLIETSTQVSASGPDGKPVIFETEKNILVTPAKLVSVYSVIKEKDKIFEHIAAINGEKPAEIFTGDNLQKHILYIGDENLFNLKEGLITINFEGTNADLLKNLEQKFKTAKDGTRKLEGSVKWQYGVKVKRKKDGKEVEEEKWEDLGTVKAIGNGIIIEKEILADEGEKAGKDAIFSDKVKVNGVESRWIRCQISEISEVEDLSFTELNISVSPPIIQSQSSCSVRLFQGIREIFYSKLNDPKKNCIETIGKLLKLNEDELAEKLGYSRTIAPNILETAKKQFSDKTQKYTPKSTKDISGIVPDSLFNNDIPIDPNLNDDYLFYPFGKKPYLYDTFYIGSKDAFSKKGYFVKLGFRLHPGKPGSTTETDKPRLSWEYWDGESWSLLELNDSNDGYKNLSEDTECTGTQDGKDTYPVLEIPKMPEVKLTKVNGKENYWIRVRLVGGNYGTEYKIDEIVTGVKRYTVVPSTFCPPQIASLKIEYSTTDDNVGEGNGKTDQGGQAGKQPEHLFADNNLIFVNCLDKLKEQEGKEKENTEENKDFKPFEPLPDVYPATYFGFDKELKKGPISLFINIDESLEYPESFLPKVKWQYLTYGDPEWKELEVLDETAGFTRKGMVQFIVSEKMKESTLFGQVKKYWIRAVITREFFTEDLSGKETKEFLLFNESAARYLKKLRPNTYRRLRINNINLSQMRALSENRNTDKNYPNTDLHARISLSNRQLKTEETDVQTRTQEPGIPQITECKKVFELFNINFIPEASRKIPPKVFGFYLNSVWAAQSRTINDEIIGSGRGEANQKFKLINAPVISEKIWINEVNSLSEQERKKLLENPSNVMLRQDSKGNILDFWVGWDRIDDFLDSKSKDRHYTIDRTYGEVCFGNGKQGMVPPIGFDNIKATYSIGGGKSGNLDALKISKLQSSIAFVDKVFNPVSSDGGAEAEDTDTLLNRAPVALKHRNRAMAAEDYEWLAKEASKKVARVKVLPNFNSEGKFSTGCVTVVIVPENSDPEPTLSSELKRIVTAYLKERCPAVVNLRVIPPFYVRTSVSAELITGSIDAIPVIEMEARRKISEFLHPLTGFAGRKGWSFGCAPCVSDIYSILEEIKNVDHVNKVTINLHSGSKVMELSSSSSIIKLPEYALPCSGEHTITVDFKNSEKGE